MYISEDWLNLAPEKFIAHITFKMCWATCVKPRIGLSGVACMTINSVRISCLKKYFNNDLKFTWW